jgi:hypothetical protein
MPLLPVDEERYRAVVLAVWRLVLRLESHLLLAVLEAHCNDPSATLLGGNILGSTHRIRRHRGTIMVETV